MKPLSCRQKVVDGWAHKGHQAVIKAHHEHKVHSQAEKEIEKLKYENKQLIEMLMQDNAELDVSRNKKHLGKFQTTNTSPKIAVPRSLPIQPSDHHIAFTVYLSRTVNQLGRQHTIPFDLVLLNEGQAYDTVLHAFTCPVDGVYVFQSAAMACYHDHIQTEIVKDGAVILQIYASGTTSSQSYEGFDQGFNSATVQCNKGQKVWVQVLDDRGSCMYGYNAERFASFSGYLLWSIER